MIQRSTMRVLCVAGVLVLLTCAVAAAQRGGGGGMGGHGMGMPGGNHGGPPPSGGGEGRTNSPMHGSTHLSLPGRFWDDKKTAKSLGLNDDQKKRMDNVFAQNRDALQSSFSNLQKSESKLDDLKNSKHPSESALSTQIDQVAQARADLEKTYTHMQLQLRDEMTPDQLNKLEDLR